MAHEPDAQTGVWAIEGHKLPTQRRESCRAHAIGLPPGRVGFPVSHNQDTDVSCVITTEA